MIHVCPYCHGKPGSFISTAGPLRCQLCGGSGEVSDSKYAAYHCGQTIRDFRVNSMLLTLRKCALLLQVSPRVLSDIETGRIGGIEPVADRVYRFFQYKTDCPAPQLKGRESEGGSPSKDGER